MHSALSPIPTEPPQICHPILKALGGGNVIDHHVAKLPGRNSRAAGFFDTRVEKGPTEGVRVVWERQEAWRDWARLDEQGRTHISICFIAYVLWKRLGRLGRQSGLGDEPRKVFREVSQIKLSDVILPTRIGAEI
jgi:hypothetical protein